MNGGNGQRTPSIPSPADFTDAEGTARARKRAKRAFWIAVVLFFLTVLSTLATGTEYSLAFAENRPPFEDGFQFYVNIWNDPGLLVAGLPFSFTLLGILLAHELGHYFACRYYGIAASFPYFVPAPTIIGTMGAFIRIRSPIVNRKALFDVGIAGPLVGFLFAVPALALAVAHSKVLAGAQASAVVLFGQPLIEKLFALLLHPEGTAANLFLHPVGRAAWVGLLATGLNLLPVGQLDGGHIVYALLGRIHRQISLIMIVILLILGRTFWSGWYVWAVLLLLLGFRHPRLIDQWEPLDAKRRAWALVALLIFALCFIPAPIIEP